MPPPAESHTSSPPVPSEPTSRKRAGSETPLPTTAASKRLRKATSVVIEDSEEDLASGPADDTDAALVSGDDHGSDTEEEDRHGSKHKADAVEEYERMREEIQREKRVSIDRLISIVLFLTIYLSRLLESITIAGMMIAHARYPCNFFPSNKDRGKQNSYRSYLQDLPRAKDPTGELLLHGG